MFQKLPISITIVIVVALMFSGTALAAGRFFPGRPATRAVLPEVSEMAPETTGIVGNFDLGECFCEVTCRHGHQTRLFNIGRGHVVACDKCKTYMFVGSNLMSSWRSEDKDTWERNHESIRGYREVRM